MKNCLILTNAYTQRESELNQAYRLREELEKCGVNAEIRRNNGALAHIGKGGRLETVSGYDFCVYLDKDKYTPLMLEKGGLRLFNGSFSVRACDDKFATSVLLSGIVRMPETYAAPLCYTEGAHVNEGYLKFIGEKLGYPLIVKTCYGSLGEGVFKADDLAALTALAEKLKSVPHLFQKYISESCGRDLRVIVIGGKCVAAMERSSKTDFRSNLCLGGSGRAAEIPGEARQICERASETLKLDYCGIDLLFGADGFYLCEVNSNAFFGGMEKVTGVNVAGLYAKYMVSEIYI